MVALTSMDMNLGKLQKIVRDRRPGVLQSMGSQRVRYDLETEQQQQVINYIQDDGDP